MGQIFEANRYADKVIEKVLKQNPKWGARDRRFIAETTYDIVRWYRLLQQAAQAQRGDYWKLIAAWCISHDVPLPPWQEFRGIAPAAILTALRAADERRVRESIPDWMDALGAQELGQRWDTELAALNEEARVVLRVNTLKVSRAQVQQRLYDEHHIETYIDAEYPDALMLRERQNIFSTGAFREGWFEVQDAGSQRIAPYLDIEPGMRIVDACAGAGGKTLHLAALSRNKGRIVAMDVEQWKLDELQKRARRAGVSNLETRLIDSTKVIKRLEHAADRVLLDVPCSGLGVLRRNPDAKWKLSASFIDEVKTLQHKILHDYSVMVKPGGILVYSTCSILSSENEQQVARFLESQAGRFELLRDEHTWPSQGFDGFYMAALKCLR